MTVAGCGTCDPGSSTFFPVKIRVWTSTLPVTGIVVEWTLPVVRVPSLESCKSMFKPKLPLATSSGYATAVAPLVVGACLQEKLTARVFLEMELSDHCLAIEKRIYDLGP